MTVFLTPDGRPFYGGTYFPDEDRHGLPGFTSLLLAVNDAWRNRRNELLAQAVQLSETLSRSSELPGAADTTGLGPEALDRAAAQLAVQYDGRFGGFGGAPKFPQAMSLDLLLRHHVRTGDPQSLEMATTTLDAMASGGMYDQLGGGFHRYSVDAQWLVPHFEKMLYDQALLAAPTSTPGWSPARSGSAGCSRRPSGTCCATCRPGRRLLLGRGRRQRGRGGPVLRLVARRAGRGGRQRGPTERLRGRRLLGRDQARELRGPQHPPHRRLRADAPRCPGEAAAGGPQGLERAAALFDRRGGPRPARPRRQGPHRVERHVPPDAGRGRRRPRAGRLDGRRPGQRPVPAGRARGAGSDVAGPPAGGGGRTAGRSTSATPRTTPRCSGRW